MIKLYGLGTALITPFAQDGSVDYEALDRLLDQQLTGDVDYIVVLGTTGEAVTLSPEEHTEVRRHIASYVNGRLPLVLGVGGNCTANVVDRLNSLYEELESDYTAILSVCPYYNKPSQEGLFRHFTAIAEASPVPVILYNVPGRTGVNMLPETVMRIYEAQPEKIMGVKEASGNVEQIKHLIELVAQSPLAHNHSPLAVISGDDGIACELMKAGADGLISVASNAFAADFNRIVHNNDEALQAKYCEMIRLLFAEGNPSGIKTVLAQKGVIENVLRLPLVPNSKTIQLQISEELNRLSK